MPVVLGRRQVRPRWIATVSLAWFGVLLLFADYPISVLRVLTQSSGYTLRIASLNCAGSAAALRELSAWQPDILLVQESPGRESLRSVAKELFGNEGRILWGTDASIIARGEIEPRPLPAGAAANAIAATITLSTNVKLNVVSLRLEPALVRIDLWSPECWREQSANRRRRRNQLRAIVSAVRPDLEWPVILGGDFNAPPGDAVFELLRPALHDGFAVAGRGWGNTIINAAPFLRIDQIWLTNDLRATSVFSVQTRHSDHRMVLCDLSATP